MKVPAVLEALVLLALVVATACDDESDGGASLPIALGDPIEVTSQTVDSSGGTIEVTEPGPLQGMLIEVPEGAYSEPTTFSIAYYPIESIELKDGFEPITPMIEVNNGGGYADDILLVTIPVEQIPDDQLALPFYYDSETGEMEAAVAMGQTATSFTFATRHFSKFAGLTFHLSDFRGRSFHTPFLPLVDGWWFPNRGSVITPDGNCNGMTLGAGWYFTHQRGLEGASPLVGPHGNLYGHPALRSVGQTTQFTLDDSEVIQLVTAIETENYVLDDWVVRKTFALWQDSAYLGGDPYTYYITLAALFVFEQPVLLFTTSHAENVYHALLAWAFTDDFIIHVYDPNYANRWDLALFFTHGPPGHIAAGYFDPYYSARNANDMEDGRWLFFDGIQFAGLSGLINTDRILQLWGEMEAGTVAAGLFPFYYLKLIDEEGEHPLDTPDGVEVESEKVTVELVADFDAVLYRFNYSDALVMAPGTNPFTIAQPTWDIELQIGDNLLGFYIEASTPQGPRWAGFEWVNIERVQVDPCGDGTLDLDELCDESAPATGCADDERCESCERCVELPSNRLTAQACSIHPDDIEVAYNDDTCPGWSEQRDACSCYGEFQYNGEDSAYLVFLVRRADFGSEEVDDSWWEVSCDVSPTSRTWNTWANCMADPECNLPDYQTIVEYGAFRFSSEPDHPCRWIFDEYRRNYDESGLPLHPFPADVCLPSNW